MAVWMTWNLFLAAIPAALAVPLFRLDRRPALGWWVMLTAFVAFLPNAPYVLTDVIHLEGDLRGAATHRHLALVVAAYGGFFVLGVGSYAFAVARLERWLRHQGWAPTKVLGVEVLLHGLCAVGLFLGRVFRFNSWDLVTQPGTVLDVVRVPQPRSVAVLTLLFVTLALGSLGVRGLLAVGRASTIGGRSVG